MKPLFALIVCSLMLVGCSTLNKEDTGNGVVFAPDVGVNIYQGPDDKGILLTRLTTASTGYWSYVSPGFEMFTAEYSNGRGGDATESINVSAGKVYFFTLTQIPGMNTPDVKISRVDAIPGVVIPPTHAGMASVYFVYPDNIALQSIIKRQRSEDALRQQLGCTDEQMRMGTCQ
ncbi:MAG: hypothetical protein WBR15_02710 [Gammaproteobacteria bacterium]